MLLSKPSCSNLFLNLYATNEAVARAMGDSGRVLTERERGESAREQESERARARAREREREKESERERDTNSEGTKQWHGRSEI